jgi:hypothetical protein
MDVDHQVHVFLTSNHVETAEFWEALELFLLSSISIAPGDIRRWVGWSEMGEKSEAAFCGDLRYLVL